LDFLQEQLVEPLSNALNSHVLIYLLIAVGVYFTLRTRFIQIRYFGRMFRQLRRSHRQDGGISSFQAFCVGLASRVGTGNIAGVAIALTVGGPGAIFWMWVVAAVGMATALIEATLGQIFKVRSDDGAFRGGPAFYIQHGLCSRAGGIAFAVLLMVAFSTAFNMVETNAVSGVLKSSHGVDTGWTAVGLAVLAASVLLLLLGYWFVSGLHSDAVPFAPGGNSGNNVGSRIDKSRPPRMNFESTEKRPTSKSTSNAERLDSGRR